MSMYFYSPKTPAFHSALWGQKLLPFLPGAKPAIQLSADPEICPLTAGSALLKGTRAGRQFMRIAIKDSVPTVGFEEWVNNLGPDFSAVMADVREYVSKNPGDAQDWRFCYEIITSIDWECVEILDGDKWLRFDAKGPDAWLCEELYLLEREVRKVATGNAGLCDALDLVLNMARRANQSMAGFNDNLDDLRLWGTDLVFDRDATIAERDAAIAERDALKVQLEEALRKRNSGDA